LPNGKAKLPPIEKEQSVDVKDMFDENEARSSTYKEDFKDRGVDMCMSKAYSILAQKRLKNPHQTVA
jgi:hypothetical protein